jgi:hypothetical protein
MRVAVRHISQGTMHRFSLSEFSSESQLFGAMRRALKEISQKTGKKQNEFEVVHVQTHQEREDIELQSGVPVL